MILTRCASSCQRSRRGSASKLNHADHVALIEDGVEGRGGRWADLGSGEGAFTLALADVLGPEAHIVAVDKDSHVLRAIAGRFETRVADFTRPLDLKDLDGVLMANSLHYVRDKEPVLTAVHAMLREGGRLIVVEYGTDRGNAWVPYPFSYQRWETMAARAGFTGTRLLRLLRDADSVTACLLPEASDPARRRALLLLGRGADVDLRQVADDHDLVVLDGDFYSREPAVREPSGKPTFDRTELFLIHALHNYTVINEMSRPTSLSTVLPSTSAASGEVKPLSRKLTNAWE